MENTSDKPHDIGAAFRTHQALLAERSEGDRIRAQQQRIDDEFASIIAGLSDDGMKQLFIAATASMPETMLKRRMLDKGVGSRLLRIRVVEFWARKGSAVHAGQTSP
jgi:hypothetical protein